MKVSVIIPLYNGIQYVNRLKSMLQRNNDNLGNNHEMEVIFVKDSIEPFNKDIFKSNTNLDITLLQNNENMGIQYSRVKGIKNSKGEFIHMLDQDDEITDDFLENALNRIEKYDVLVCNGKKKYKEYSKILYKYKFMQWTVKYKWFYTNFSCRILSPGQCIINKSSIPKIWMENILINSGTDDAMLWLTMLTDKCRFKLDYEVRYIHNNTDNNLSLDLNRMKMSLEEMIGLCRKVQCIDEHSLIRMEKKLNGNSNNTFIKVIEKINKEK